MTTDVLKKLQKLAEREQQSFVSYYIANSETICDWIRTFDGVKAQMNLHNVRNQIEYLRFAVVFSDLLTLFTLGQGEKKITVPKADKTQSFVNTLTIPQEVLSKYNFIKSPSDIIPGYITCSFEQLREFSIDLRSLISKGRIILRPDRIVLTLTNEKGPQGERIWQVLGVDQDSPVKQWIITEKTAQTHAIPIFTDYRNDPTQKDLQTIIVPYLSGISLSEIEKVLEDNNDLVSSFRNNIKELLKNYRSSKDLTQINNDLIKPDVERINRKFKQISGTHRMRVAGIVTVSAVITLASLTTIGINAAIYGLLGAAGLGLINSDSKYKEAISKLEDNPMFLLWKIKELKK